METFPENIETHSITIPGTDVVLPIPFDLIILLVARFYKSCELQDPGSGKLFLAGVLGLSPSEPIPDCIQQAIASAEATAARRSQEICDSLTTKEESERDLILLSYDVLICEGFISLSSGEESGSQSMTLYYDEFRRAFSTSLSLERLVRCLFLHISLGDVCGRLFYQALSALLSASRNLCFSANVKQNMGNPIDLFCRRFIHTTFHDAREMMLKVGILEWEDHRRFYDVSQQQSYEKFHVGTRLRDAPIWSETLLKITLPLGVACAGAEFAGINDLPHNTKIVFVAAKITIVVAIVSNFSCYALEKARIPSARAAARIMGKVEKFTATLSILGLMGALLPAKVTLWITGAVCGVLLLPMAYELIE